MGTLNLATPQNMLSGSFWYGRPEDVVNQDLVFPTTNEIFIGYAPDGMSVSLTGTFQISSSSDLN